MTDNLETSKYTYRITVLKSPVINAFSMPGGYIVIYTGLINFCETPEELAGVIAHEMGHNENQDMMKRMAKNIGISISINAIFGDNNKVREIFQQVVSTKFDRSQEETADAFAVYLMQRCQLNPEHLAQFFERLLEKKPEILNQIDFIMSHPADDKRIKAIRTLSKEKKFIEQPIDINWDALKSYCE